MRKIALIAIAVIFLVIAGCTTTPVATSPAGTTAPATTSHTKNLPKNALPMHSVVPLGNATHGISVWIDSFELAPQADNSTEVAVYVAAKNTGQDPIKFVWFSKLTEKNGDAYGGIGCSHNGNGARTAWIFPNRTEAAKDFVVVDSAEHLAAFQDEAVLDVYFMEQGENVTPSLKPDYHVAWAIDPGAILPA
ncbi:MAG: hypothetical protein METHP_00540 [Methanoregula sp. SKADARSKE-2]|nr:MAG: hypothetical protein METHP_00540 [Methanoregula sp. SKADARSKE-2]